MPQQYIGQIEINLVITPQHLTRAAERGKVADAENPTRKELLGLFKEMQNALAESNDGAEAIANSVITEKNSNWPAG